MEIIWRCLLVDTGLGFIAVNFSAIGFSVFSLTASIGRVTFSRGSLVKENSMVFSSAGLTVGLFFTISIFSGIDSLLLS